MKQRLHHILFTIAISINHTTYGSELLDWGSNQNSRNRTHSTSRTYQKTNPILIDTEPLDTSSFPRISTLRKMYEQKQNSTPHKKDTTKINAPATTCAIETKSQNGSLTPPGNLHKMLVASGLVSDASNTSNQK